MQYNATSVEAGKIKGYKGYVWFERLVPRTRLPASDGKDKPPKAPKIPKAAAKKAAAAKPGGGVAGQAKSAPARRANGKQPDQWSHNIIIWSIGCWNFTDYGFKNERIYDVIVDWNMLFFWKKWSPGKLRFESVVGYPHWQILQGWDPTVGFPTQSCYVWVALRQAGRRLTAVEVAFVAKGYKTYPFSLLFYAKYFSELLDSIS